LQRDEASSRMNETEFAQPAIFAIQIALAALWQSWGVRPHRQSSATVWAKSPPPMWQVCSICQPPSVSFITVAVAWNMRQSVAR